MVEIWTEDSNNGYEVLNCMIKNVTSSCNIMVKPHSGNGRDTPVNGGNGGLIYDLEQNRNNKNPIILIADYALDNNDVVEDIGAINNELKENEHRINNHVLTKIYSFEYGMLTYNELTEYVRLSANNKLMIQVKKFLSAIKNSRFDKSILEQDDIEYFSSWIDAGDSGEVIAKSLLSEITNYPNIIVRSESNNTIHSIPMACINKNGVGNCWKESCCPISWEIERRCGRVVGTSIADKMINLCYNSEFSNCMNDICSTIRKVSSEKYNAPKNAEYYENMAKKSLNKEYGDIRVRLAAIEYIQKYSERWNYSSLSNAINSGRLAC